MSSLVVGRQRRGKLELSTINDISKMVSAEQIYPLGYEITVPGTKATSFDDDVSPSRQPLGDLPQTWVYVQNNDGAFWRTGTWLRHAGSAGAIVPGDPAVQRVSPFYVSWLGPAGTFGCPSSAVVGVAQHLIREREYGFILRKGKGIARFFNTTVCSGGDYLIADAANQGYCIGLARNAAIPSDGCFGMILDTLDPDPDPTGLGYTNSVYVNCLG